MQKLSTSIAGITAALLVAGSASAVEPNPIQSKYRQPKTCAARGQLKKLTREYKCHINIDKCDASLHAVQGKLSPGFVGMLADLTRPAGKKLGSLVFKSDCGSSDGQFEHLLGIAGVGYVGNQRHVPLLTNLISAKNIGPAGANVREAVAYSLYYMGDKKRSVPALTGLIKYGDKGARYKRPALQALARWGATTAAGYCKNALSSRGPDGVRQSCIYYLGELKQKSARSKLERSFEKYPKEVARSLGRMGDKGAIRFLEAQLSEAKAPHKRLPLIGALINLGKTKYLKDLTIYISGDKPLTAREKERIAKNKARAKKRGRTYKPRKRSISGSIARQAAIESTFIKTKSVSGKINAALSRLANSDNRSLRGAKVYGHIALAQRGKSKSTTQLIKLLDDPKEKIRDAARNGVGGRDHNGNILSDYWGLGVVPDKRLLPALAKYYDNESNQQRKISALRAMAAIRAALR